MVSNIAKIRFNTLKGLPYQILNCQSLTIDFKKKSLVLLKNINIFLKIKEIMV